MRRAFRFLVPAFACLLIAPLAAQTLPPEADIPALQRRAEQGDAQAQFDLGKRYQQGQGVRADFRKALGYYRQAAKQNHPLALNNLGVSYETGNGVPRDPVQAKAYYQAAAKLGSMVAQYNLGTFLYKSAAGDDAALREAFRYFTQAAELGHINAMRALAEFYRGGRIIPKDDAAVLLWIRKAEAAGCVKAKTDLAIAYQRGLGVVADLPVAVALYRQAAEGGDVVAQHNLGLRYARGEGVPLDNAEAVRWFRKAADQGFARSMSALGVTYEGSGDKAEALRLYRLAAERGDSDGQTNLGRAQAEGVPADLPAAFMWLTLAANQNGAAARAELAKLTPRLTPAQLRQGEAAARSWRPRPAPASVGPSDKELGCENG
ncbi:tetratricopeptide repeat protein [Bosea sp. BK604]|uniref:tetratricopeptide repeat protein n=1 Tax=Bosea sp. BK604 TaxID=2512180 RepID=UPI0010EB576D|nr:tetratricopeptide repeat protein [Bosea sp. BK604]TCR68682.1 TPR repeat protein [Bosea sp. BK604]